MTENTCAKVACTPGDMWINQASVFVALGSIVTGGGMSNCPVTTSGPYDTINDAQGPRLSLYLKCLRVVLKTPHGFVVGFVHEEYPPHKIAQKIYQACGYEMVSCEGEDGVWRPYQLEKNDE